MTSATEPGGRNLLQYARHYQALPFEPVAAAVRRRTVLGRVARWAPQRLLEVGCGDAPLFTDLPDVDVVVVEPADAFVAAARAAARAERRGRGSVSVHQSLVEDVRPADLGGPFDLVVVSSLLHEVPDPEAVLRRAADLCGPGGIVHVNVPSATSLHRRLGTAMGLLADPTAVTPTGVALEQHTVFDATSLSALVGRCGLEVEARGGILVKPFSHEQMAAALAAGVVDDAVVDGLDRWAELEPDLASEVWLDARRGRG